MKFLGTAVACTLSFCAFANQTAWIYDWKQGVELVQQKHYHGALYAYDRAIDGVPHCPPYLKLERAEVLCFLNHYQRALRDLNYVLKSTHASQDQKAKALRLRAHVQSMLGKPNLATQDMRRAENLLPLSRECLNSKEYVVFEGKAGHEAHRQLIAKMYRSFGLIDTEEDFILSPSGMHILKRGKQTYLQGSFEAIRKAVEAVVESMS